MNREDIITGNAFKNLADDFLDEEKPYIDITKKPKIIFLKTDWIELFKAKILPKIDYKFKLITHNADRPAPSGNIDLLEDPRLIMWYGMNCQIIHSKLLSIPIGIANEKWPHGNKEELMEIINTNIPKTLLCYSNFDTTTNFIKRTNIFNIIKTKTFIDSDQQKYLYKNYLAKLKSYKYVISPPGNSIDCHRVWESIYLGVVPIIERDVAMEAFYDLPILIVNSFNDITIDLLQKEYKLIHKRQKNKAYISFYRDLILA